MRKTSDEILCKVFECEIDDLEFTIKSNPEIDTIKVAMELYAKHQLWKLWKNHPDLITGVEYRPKEKNRLLFEEYLNKK